MGGGGGKFGGWALYTKGRKPKDCYNYMARGFFYVEGAEEIPLVAFSGSSRWVSS